MGTCLKCPEKPKPKLWKPYKVGGRNGYCGVAYGLKHYRNDQKCYDTCKKDAKKRTDGSKFIMFSVRIKGRKGCICYRKLRTKYKCRRRFIKSNRYRTYQVLK